MPLNEKDQTNLLKKNSKYQCLYSATVKKKNLIKIVSNLYILYLGKKTCILII